MKRNTLTAESDREERMRLKGNAYLFVSVQISLALMTISWI